MKTFFEKYGHLLGLSEKDLRDALSALDDAALAEVITDAKAFGADVKAAAAAGTDATAETTSVLRGAVIVKKYADAMTAERQAEVEATTADVLSDLAELADEEEGDAEGESETDGAEGDGEAEGESGAEGEGEGEASGEAAAAPPAKPRPRVPAAALADGAKPRNELSNTSEPETPKWVATAGVDGKSAGEEFADRSEIGLALAKRFETISEGGQEKITVARLHGTFDDAHVLTKDFEENKRKLGVGVEDQAIVAAICAPVEPYYGIATMSSTARPLRGSLGTFAAPRGGVSVYPSPRLSDVVSGRGIWTKTDDAANTKVKNCAVIPCSNPTEYDIYGIYRCMTITNMMAMTYPELVDAFLNRLEALQASLAESTLLNAMVGSANTRNLTADLALWGYSARQSLLDTVIETLVAYREQERYDEGQRFDSWANRWLRWKLAIDLVNRKNIAGSVENVVAAVADVEAALRDAGLDMTWVIDYASNWTQTPVLPADSNPIPALPSTANIIMSPKGNFRVLDRGDLNIGVTNNNIYRDNESNSHNTFTMFFENFEGLIDMGATSVELTLSNVHAHGAQVTDASISTR